VLEKDGNINWTEYVRHTDVLQRAKEEENVLQITKERKDNWIGHMLRRNCGLNTLLKER